MNGADYVALVRIASKVMVNGRLGFATIAKAGDTCERVPEVALPGLLARGRIEARPRKPAETPMPAGLDQPATLLVGEAGPEVVTVRPSRRGARAVKE